MDRLLVVRCPDLLDEDEDGTALRSFVEVVDAVEAYCPWITAVRPGLCSLPARGPARYFGGEDALIRSIVGATSDITPVEVGVADGLFAAVLAARRGLVVPPGGTPDFLAPLPVGILGNPGLAELLARLGIRTLGDFAALPASHVLGRFGADGVTCHRVAGGRSGELAELRQPLARRRVDEQRGGGRPSGRGSSHGTPGSPRRTAPSALRGPARSPRRHPWSCTRPRSVPNWSMRVGSRSGSRDGACSPPPPAASRWRRPRGQR